MERGSGCPFSAEELTGLLDEIVEAYPALTLIVDSVRRLLRVNRPAREMFSGTLRCWRTGATFCFTLAGSAR